jgi:hypothetical protein
MRFLQGYVNSVCGDRVFIFIKNRKHRCINLPA